MSKTYPHSEYYRDRRSEHELCCDFPGNELFINGLHAMQVHFYNNGTNIEIPVLRVMNTAHYLAAYIFSTTCSGDQLEYDALANISLGRDKRMFKVAIIVLETGNKNSAVKSWVWRKTTNGAFTFDIDAESEWAGISHLKQRSSGSYR